MELVDLVAAAQAEWDEPVVERAVFGFHQPAEIAASLALLCQRELGSTIARSRFYAVSVGVTAGVLLEDGRELVLKLVRGNSKLTFLEACRDVQSALAAAGFPCPTPLFGPVAWGQAWASGQSFLSGERADGHQPAVRAALAQGLARLVSLARPFVDHPGLFGAWFTSLPGDRIYPRPHSPLFDFERTREGAEWIDALAAKARERREERAGERVVGHFDWRAEHVRMQGSALVATYDWDSLHVELEPVMVGANAHAFTADWSRSDLAPAPSFEEMCAWVESYEHARGRSFTRAERHLLEGSLVYSLAYTARCGHALSHSEEGQNGDYRRCLRACGERILARGLE